jgi:hypothetical protein
MARVGIKNVTSSFFLWRRHSISSSSSSSASRNNKRATKGVKWSRAFNSLFVRSRSRLSRFYLKAAKMAACLCKQQRQRLSGANTSE